MSEPTREKVLVLTTSFPRWEDDTAPSFVDDLSREITEKGFDVVVLAPHHPGAKRRESMMGFDVYRYPYIFPKRFQRLCYEGSILDTVKSDVFAVLQVPLLVISLFLHTLWLIWKEDVDFVHSHWLVPNGLVAATVRRFTGTPHVMTLHAGGVLGVKELPFSSQIALFVAARTDVIVPVSSYIQNTFVEMLPSDVTTAAPEFRVQPMGTDAASAHSHNGRAVEPASDHEGPVVGLFVGRLAPKKGVEYLIDAVQQVEAGPEEFQLILVGPGPLEGKIEQLIDDRGLADQVRLTGWINDEELDGLYAHADFTVVPSIQTASGDTEGMPIVIAEAFAAGNPVLASDVGGISDVVRDGENGYLVAQKRPDKLAEQMHSLIENDRRRSEMAKQAREDAAELDWGACGETYAHVFGSVREHRDDGTESTTA